MTTLEPTPPLPPAPVVDPHPNKAVATAVTALITVAVQWLATGELELDQEGITAIGGAVATVLVYAVSNWKPKGF